MTREMLMREPTKKNDEAEEEVKRPNRGTNPSSYNKKAKQLKKGYKK